MLFPALVITPTLENDPRADLPSVGVPLDNPRRYQFGAGYQALDSIPNEIAVATSTLAAHLRRPG